MGNIKLAEFVGKTINEKRLQKKLSQEKLAEMLGTTQDVISRMEQGNFSIKFERLERMADIFTCQVIDFFRLPDTWCDDDTADIADMLNGLSQKDKYLVKGTVAEMVRLMKNNLDN